MQQQNLDNYKTARFAKMLAVAPAKAGKTCFLVAQALGVFPGQKYGGIVSHPSDLHVLTFDSGAATGVAEFLTEICGLPKEHLKEINIYNFQDDVREMYTSERDYDGRLLYNVIQARQQIADKSRNKCGVMIVSSLTGLAIGLERSIMGSVFGKDGQAKRGYGDMSKWNLFKGWIQELQNNMQADEYHCIWEGHLYKPPPKPQKSKNQFEDDEAEKETIQVSGKAGVNFPYNCEQMYYLERTSQRIDGTKCDKVIIDTKPTLNMISMQGRMASTRLEPKEYDLTYVFHKLGLKVGKWTYKKTEEVK